ncbi:MAG TPA: GAF domain-containing protein [Trichocoleus sp.]|jgi:PAS domain S-box-containing protein
MNSPEPDFRSLESIEAQITPIDQAQKLVLESFFAAASAASIGFCIYDAEMRFLAINEALAERNGLSIAAHLGRSIREVLSVGLSEMLEPLCRQVLETGEPIINVEFQGESLSPSGNEHYVVASYFPVSLPDGKGVGVILELTSNRHIITVLRNHEARFRSLVQSSYDIITLTDARFNTTTQTPDAQTRILGYLPPELPPLFPFLGSELLLVHPDDAGKVEAARQELLAKPGHLIQVEYRMQRADGTWVWLESIGTNWFHNPQIRAVVGNTRDINRRKQAETALQQQIERERLLRRIALRIRGSLDLNDILNTTATEICQFLKADRVLIKRYQSTENFMRKGNGELKFSAVVEALGSGSTSCLHQTQFHSSLNRYLDQFQAGIKEAIDDLNSPALPNDFREWAAQLQIRACLIMPILVGDQFWGLLVAHQCHHSRHWEDSEVELLEQLATQLSIAIQQSELYQRIQDLNDCLEMEVEARTTQLKLAFNFEETLKRITDRVRDSLDEDQILQAVVRELAQVIGVHCCNASLYDLEQGTSTTCYEYANSMSLYQGRVSQFSAVPEIYTQLLEGQYFQFCSLVPNTERGRVTMLACPILDDQGVIGDLWLIHQADYAFNDQDVRLVQQVANQCAIAIRQARLYEASQVQIQELERLNQLKDDFLSTVSHELRTPLANMKMAIHMLRSAPTPERQERYMQILEAECNRETELINDLLDLQRLENESYGTVIEPIDLQTWIPEIVNPFLSRIRSRQQQLQINLPPQIEAIQSDRRCLERILAELLNNACKYTSPKGTIALEVKFQNPALANRTSTNWALKGPTQKNQTSVVCFTVSNQAAVSQFELPRMFEKFYRIPKSDPWQQGGTGLGLALVKKLVETLQGTISAESENGWTTFTVQLPTFAETE